MTSAKAVHSGPYPRPAVEVTETTVAYMRNVNKHRPHLVDGHQLGSIAGG